MNAKKFVVAGVVGGVVNAIYSMLVCNLLIQPWLERITGVDFWVPIGGIHIPIMIIFGFAICFLWAFGYALLYKAIPGKGVIKGIVYGLLLWLLALLPHTLALHLHTTIWPEFNWVFLTANNLIRWMILGIFYGAIYKLD